MRVVITGAPKHPGDATLVEFLRALRQRRGHAGPLLYPRRIAERAD
jgi:hypothetical protein